MKKLTFVLIVCFSLLFVFSTQAAIEEKKPEPILSMSRPEADKGPTKVYGGIWLIDIDSIDSSAQNFVANVFIILRWMDPRLADPRGIRIYNITQVWNPRIQISNEIGLVRRTFPEVVEVDKDGMVTYRQRFVGPFSQPLKLNDFPFDKQTFRLHFVSPGNAPTELEFIRDPKWIEAGLPKAGGIAKDISLPDWTIENYDTSSVPYVTGPGAAVAGFAFDFLAKRDIEYYVWKVILPLLFIVMMSWTVFWIDPSNASTQIAVATTSMLTLIAYRFAIDLQVPRVPYFTKLDQFIVAGTALVFLCLIQVIITARLALTGREKTAKKIDKMSKIVFPLAFIISLSIALLK